MVYPFTEQATAVTGEVVLTDESSGQSTRYKAGDGWLSTEIPTDSVNHFSTARVESGVTQPCIDRLSARAYLGSLHPPRL
jgi:hypothetical protein